MDIDIASLFQGWGTLPGEYSHWHPLGFQWVPIGTQWVSIGVNGNPLELNGWQWVPIGNMNFPIVTQVWTHWISMGINGCQWVPIVTQWVIMGTHRNYTFPIVISNGNPLYVNGEIVIMGVNGYHCHSMGDNGCPLKLYISKLLFPWEAIVCQWGKSL